jgi:hypothetical protein
MDSHYFCFVVIDLMSKRQKRYDFTKKKRDPNYDEGAKKTKTTKGEVQLKDHKDNNNSNI